MYKLLSTVAKSPINITDTAWKKIVDILTKSNAQGMVFSATGGGCNGFYYNFEIMSKSDVDLSKSKIKITYVEKEQSKVYIDPSSEMLLLGTTIDYIEEDYNKGVYESKFVYKADNNIATSCGCGVSFSPK